MKIYSFAIAVIAALALGSLFGFNLGNNPGAPAAAPEAAAPQVSVSQPVIVSEASAVEAAPSAADPASVAPAPAEAPVGTIGVLQSINSDSLTVQTREGLQLLTFTGPASIDQLKVGDKVAVWAQNFEGRMVVRQIVVVPESPQRMHYLGLVSSATPDRIDVVGQQGETTSFRLDATLQLMPDASRKPQVGDTVTVVAKADPLGDGWLAVAVVAR